ncbi:hypothetical protein E4A49_03325 [Micrococcus lylae]|uniref:Uncharacterized protein n=1 Tax=Micrococcus lylae TaxID=1273 RepID=A0ABY2K494_9MICC|nr:hypothetical protein E4A49_03325 [Micrococcus lylae]
MHGPEPAPPADAGGGLRLGVRHARARDQGTGDRGRGAPHRVERPGDGGQGGGTRCAHRPSRASCAG